MAAKHARREFDWTFIVEKAAKQKDLVKSGVAKTVVNQISLDDLLAMLTPERRRELAKKIDAGKK